MAQEFVIKSQDIEDKINQLLPSQGGFQAGVDFSASTMVVPIIDLTETAEGSTVRPDLQTSLSLKTATSFSVTNTTTTIINTTGYFRIRGRYNVAQPNAGNDTNTISLTDGATTKIIDKFVCTSSGGTGNIFQDFDFIVFLAAGDSCTIFSDSTSSIVSGSTRQIADINGNLIDP